jgi:hypothetical protein
MDINHEYSLLPWTVTSLCGSAVLHTRTARSRPSRDRVSIVWGTGMDGLYLKLRMYNNRKKKHHEGGIWEAYGKGNSKIVPGIKEGNHIP